MTNPTASDLLDRLANQTGGFARLVLGVLNSESDTGETK